MSRSIVLACSTCVVLGATVFAQTPVPPRAPQPAPKVTAQTMTLTGCLEPWNPATMQVGGTTAGAQQYVLTNAESATPAAATTAGAPVAGAAQPPSGTTPLAGAHDTYLLKATPGMDLAGWANQQVRVMGTLMVASAVQPGAPTGTTGMAPSTPTTSTGGTPTTSSGGTPTTSTGGTPTTATAGTPTTGTTPPAGATGTTGSTAAANAAAAATAAARSTFTVMSIALVQKTCTQ